MKQFTKHFIAGVPVGIAFYWFGFTWKQVGVFIGGLFLGGLLVAINAAKVKWGKIITLRYRDS